MPNDNRVNQKNVNAKTVSGRDTNIDNSTKIYSSSPIYHEDKILKKLLIEHELEKSSDPEYRIFSDELNKFFCKALNPKIRNLEEKLFDGGRTYLIESAMESKEKVTKKIEKYTHYKSAQEVYTYLLTEIRTAFLHEVQAKIKSGNFKEYEIDEIVSSKIIEPLIYNLSDSSLYIDKSELYGLLYFLTGNCYVEWD